MPVLAVAVGAGGRCGEQGGSGEDSEQQALHRVLGSALRVWALCGGCLGCCGGAVWEIWVLCLLRPITPYPIPLPYR
jgi:hypothetical protein